MEVAAQDIALITLLLIISAVGIATLWLRLPYPIALVLAGLALGAIIHISKSQRCAKRCCRSGCWRCPA